LMCFGLKYGECNYLRLVWTDSATESFECYRGI
jgi:hypothetical protein